MIIVTFLLIGASLIVSISAAKPKNVFEIYRIENDCPKEKLLFYMRNVSIESKNGTNQLRFDAILLETITEDMKITKCLDKGDLNSCEDLQKLTLPRFCTLLKMPGPWTVFLDVFVPKIVCPLSKGTYKMTENIVIDGKQIERLKLDRGYFIRAKARIAGMTSNRSMMCFKVEGKM